MSKSQAKLWNKVYEAECVLRDARTKLDEYLERDNFRRTQAKQLFDLAVEKSTEAILAIDDLKNSGVPADEEKLLERLATLTDHIIAKSEVVMTSFRVLAYHPCQVHLKIVTTMLPWMQLRRVLVAMKSKAQSRSEKTSKSSKTSRTQTSQPSMTSSQKVKAAKLKLQMLERRQKEVERLENQRLDLDRQKNEAELQQQQGAFEPQKQQKALQMQRAELEKRQRPSIRSYQKYQKASIRSCKRLNLK